MQRFRDKETGQFVSSRVFKGIRHAIAAIARDAKRSIQKSDKPSRPGRPPHTRKGRFKFAIRYAVDEQKKSAVAGPRKSVVDMSGRAHEMGGKYKGDYFEQRAYMEPALERNVHRFGGQFTGSVGG